MRRSRFVLGMTCAGILMIAGASLGDTKKEASIVDDQGPPAAFGTDAVPPGAVPARAGNLWILGNIVLGVEDVVMTWAPATAGRNGSSAGPTASRITIPGDAAPGTTAADDASREAATHTDGVPARFALGPGVPNPFSGSTLLRFDLPERSRVRLGVYDVQGRLVNALVAEDLDAGRHQRRWDGTDASRRTLVPGVYLVRMEASGLGSGARMSTVRKVLMLR